MKAKLFLLIFCMSIGSFIAQKSRVWQQESIVNSNKIKASSRTLPAKKIFNLNIRILEQEVENAPKRAAKGSTSNVIVSIPNADGQFEQFSVFEASVMEPELQARFPEIRSYAGQGIDDPSATIRFSISPLGFHSMVLSAHREATFIEPYTNDLQSYVVYKRSQRIDYNDDFECSVTEQVNNSLSGNVNAQKNADDGIKRTFRLAVSTTGEYTAYHGGSKAQALAAINTTMTRVNGVFENDFNVTMVLVSNTDDVIYTNGGSDPYTSSGSYNGQLQSTLTSNIGESNYDVGHLFATSTNSGNAGCIGCVCVNNQKGSGWTARTVPEGDPFDIDYVAHELGHQFGANPYLDI